MLDQEYRLFEEKLTEMAQALRAPLPLSQGLVKHLWMATRGFDLAAFRQACDDLIASVEFFPKPVELKRACEVYGRKREQEQPFRCMHVDYARPPLPDDTWERHWRCPATFEYAAGELYCPAHQKLYAREAPPASARDISESFAESLACQPSRGFLREVTAERARRLAMGEHPVSAAWHALAGAIGETMPDAHDSAEVVQVRKDEQRRRATDAGFLPHAPELHD